MFCEDAMMFALRIYTPYLGDIIIEYNDKAQRMLELTLYSYYVSGYLTLQAPRSKSFRIVVE